MTYDEIKDSLKSKDIAAAFPAILQKANSIGNWDVTEEVENLWTTYQQMLLFMLNGAKDPQAGKIREEICRKLMFATQRLERLERVKNSANEKYTAAAKSLSSIPSFEVVVSRIEHNTIEIERAKSDELLRESKREYSLSNLREEHEQNLLNLFNWTWTSEAWTSADVDQANRIVLSDTISSNDKAVFISAVTLSLLEYIDTVKIIFLLDCYLIDDTQVSQRALVGFIIILHLFFDKISDNNDIKNRLAIYREDQIFIHDCYSTMMQLQLSCTTDSVTSKMRNDILPALMQNQMMKNKDFANLDISELTKNGENPEWVDDAKFDKKVREMADLQLDGADVYYSSFASLKGYSFFHQMPHWFYPFSSDNPCIPEISSILNGKMGRIIKLMLNGSPFCNSDKYSLCFTFKQLGSFGEAAIEQQVKQQIDEENMNDLIEDAEQKKLKKTDIRRHYIFDLYRFYHSYPYKIQFFNPFNSLKQNPITPFSNIWIKNLLADSTEELSQYAEFLMRKEFYSTALELFDKVPKNEFEEEYSSIWQKIGFCQQKLNKTEEAIKAYTIANNLKPRSKWTLRHLASLCFSNSREAEAAIHYQELLDIEPENIKFLMNAAEALAKSDQFDDAQSLLFKINYLDSNNMEAKIMLAWNLIVCNQKDKAMKHILDILASNPDNKEANKLYAIVFLLDQNTRDAYEKAKTFSDDKLVMDSLINNLYVLCKHQLLDKNQMRLFIDAITLNII